ncbi:MAG: hypothetical protein PVF34_13305 [Gammaproteobacteria bacterium]
MLITLVACVIATCIGSLYGTSSVNATPLLQDIDRRLENISLEKLAHVQADPHNKPAPFTTDGCSGGLSDGWEYLADRFSSFREQLGLKPPWEACCIAHDRAYWKGETSDGYEKRLQADKELRQCVIDTGHRRSGELAERLETSAEQMEDAFNVAAALMYRAVRLGGKPCTRLPWRWGYGWPPCPLIMKDNNDANP